MNSCKSRIAFGKTFFHGSTIDRGDSKIHCWSLLLGVRVFNEQTSEQLDLNRMKALRFSIYTCEGGSDIALDGMFRNKMITVYSPLVFRLLYLLNLPVGIERCSTYPQQMLWTTMQAHQAFVVRLLILPGHWSHHPGLFTKLIDFEHV